MHRRFPNVASWRSLVPVVLLLSLTRGASAEQAAPAAQALKIVVLQGENAVNIIQQQTAVAPIVQVLDVNNQPVVGAVVRFVVQGGRATFDGASALSVTTNAAGRAAVAGLTPTTSGALQITATASFQGQTAAITIAQTNVLTAAQAATLTSAGASSGGGGAAAGGSGAAAGGGSAVTGAGVAAGAGAAAAGAGAVASGAGAAGAGAATGGAATGGAAAAAGGAAAGSTAGGLSAATIGIVSGAAAGGTLALKEAGVIGSPKRDTYVGSFSGILRNTTDNGSCYLDSQVTGQLYLEISISDAGAVTGEASVEGTATRIAFTPPCTGSPEPRSIGCCDKAPTVTGTTANFGFNMTEPGQAAGVTLSYAFTGTLTGTTIVGNYTTGLRQVPQGNGVGNSGYQTFPVTLTKQQ